MRDHFAFGEFPVTLRSLHAHDSARGRTFPCEVWHPETAGTYPLIVFSHSSGGGRKQSTYLCEHLASHGYIVASMDHSEVVAPELARKEGETAEERYVRGNAMIASRVPDIRFLLDFMLGIAEFHADATRIGIVGHSFGGWTALAAPDDEPRIRAVVALAPAGSSKIKPGILPAKLRFDWRRDVPTLVLAAGDDISLPLEWMMEVYERIPATKQMVVLRRADHLHFMDNVEQVHEAVRAMKFEGDLDWIAREMKPMAELCSGEVAHLFTKGLTLAHLDSVLKGEEESRRFLAGGLRAELSMRSIDAWVV